MTASNKAQIKKKLKMIKNNLTKAGIFLETQIKYKANYFLKTLTYFSLNSFLGLSPYANNVQLLIRF